jgi:hypothetical protein
MTLKELKQKADELGIKYPKNITFAVLEKKIAEFDGDTSESIEDEVEEKEQVSVEEKQVELNNIKPLNRYEDANAGLYDDSKFKTNEYVPDSRIKNIPIDSAEGKALSKEQRLRALITRLKKKASEFLVVTITDNDQRVNNHTSTVTVTCANEHFDLGTVVLPLNTPIEVQRGFIEVLQEVRIPMHIKGKSGNSYTAVRPRFHIALEQQTKIT